jgi:hypothetical protein
MPEFKKGTAFLPSTFSGKVKNQRKLKTTEKLRTPENSLKGRNDGRLMPWGSTDPVAESNFIWSFAQCHVISLLK